MAQGSNAITAWMYQRCVAAGVTFRFNVFAEKAVVLETNADAVIMATGGLPNLTTVNGAHEHALSVWDVMSAARLGDAANSGANVLVFDDTGGHGGISAAQVLATTGAQVELVTPDRSVAEGVGVTNHAVHLRNVYATGVRCSSDLRLMTITPDGNQLRTMLVNEYSQIAEQRVVDKVVIDAGTVPLDDVFRLLLTDAVNDGTTDPQAFISALPQPALSTFVSGSGQYALFRIGDAVSGRGLHASVLDATRLCSAL
jgi:dimethylglycine catabolism A